MLPQHIVTTILLEIGNVDLHAQQIPDLTLLSVCSLTMWKELKDLQDTTLQEMKL
jgi:hypothetical protein